MSSIRLFDDRAQTTGTRFTFASFLGDCLESCVGELQVGFFHREQPLVLLGERVLRFGEHADQGFLIKRRECA